MEIIDDYIDVKHLDKMNNFILSNNFDWYLQGVTVDNDLNHKQFVHIFYKNYNFTSNHRELIYPILDQLNPLSIYRIKLNLLPKTETIIKHPFHHDHTSNKLNSAIFYLNTNNGYTRFKKSKNILSKKNRLVSFTSTELHSGTTCTDEDFRLVLNIVYLKL